MGVAHSGRQHDDLMMGMNAQAIDAWAPMCIPAPASASSRGQGRRLAPLCASVMGTTKAIGM